MVRREGLGKQNSLSNFDPFCAGIWQEHEVHATLYNGWVSCLWIQQIDWPFGSL